MKRLIFFFCVLLLVSCGTPEPLTVTEVRYNPVSIDISEAVAILEESRPSKTPDFPEDLPESADEIETLLYLGNVISAYKTCLEAWQNYSKSQSDVLIAIQKELKNDST